MEYVYIIQENMDLVLKESPCIYIYIYIYIYCFVTCDNHCHRVTAQLQLINIIITIIIIIILKVKAIKSSETSANTNQSIWHKVPELGSSSTPLWHSSWSA
jgi:hypothetical protein